MKSFWTCVIVVLALPLSGLKHPQPATTPSAPLPVSRHVFIITTDGFRWQELFNGADEKLVANASFTPDPETINLLYGGATAEERRGRLMPFFWNVIASRGRIYGNRKYGNKVDVSNLYARSYPGYNEVFTGKPDLWLSSNRKINNPNENVLEYLNSLPEFEGRVAAFTSWDVFPYILNTERSHLPLNSGYTGGVQVKSPRQQMINRVEENGVNEKTATRFDQLTYLTAKEYISRHQPKVVFLGLGETDEFAHEGRYDLYLQQAAEVDRMIAGLWHWVQTTPEYKDNTTFIITTDHGRGSHNGKWTSHGEFIRGSSQAWFAIMGPGITPMGEIKTAQQHYLSQMAPTIAGLVGEKFSAAENIPVLSVN